MKKKWLIVLGVFLCLGFIVIYLTSNKCLKIQSYDIDERVTQPICIVQLTDLHNQEFGNENEHLIGKVREQTPDIIVMTGDMLNQDEGAEIICSLIEKLVPIAPVYFSMGNHEIDWELGSLEELSQQLTDAGAVVLNCEYVDVEVNGQMLRIGGYYGYYSVPHMRTKDAHEQLIENTFAEDFEDTENLKILLCHIPTAWVDWNYIDKYPVDLVFSGHYHGGQIKLPFVGGLYAPYVGWFPENTEGIFQGTQATCILSTGLGSEHTVPRFNNPLEIVVVDLIPSEESNE